MTQIIHKHSGSLRAFSQVKLNEDKQTQENEELKKKKNNNLKVGLLGFFFLIN